MIIAAAQISPQSGDINVNLDSHYRFIEAAAEHQVQLLLFPELSLSGYERELADEFSFTANDSRLNKLQELAKRKHMIIIVGAPIKLSSKLHIGSFIFHPVHPVSIYTKQFLHTGEEEFFTANSDYNPQISFEDELFSLAICADITNPLHVENACKAGTTTYLASIFYTANGMPEGCNLLQDYAKRYSLNILMANYTGESYNLKAGGMSSFWGASRNLIAQAQREEEALIIAKKSEGTWSAKSHTI